MFRKSLQWAAAIVLLSFASGCVDVTVLVSVNKDGSGTITETAYMGANAMQMMSGMMNEMGGDTAQPQNPLLDESKAQQRAAQLGAGVKLVSLKEVKKQDGSMGARAEYSFPDVTKLSVTPNGGVGNQGPAQNDQAVRFGFTRGQTPTLTVEMPAMDMKGGPGMGPDGKPKKPSPQELMMMKSMLGGMRMRLLMKVDGEITKTNANHVVTIRKTGKKSGLVLMDINFDKIFESDPTFEKVAAAGSLTDKREAAKQLAAIPGFKIESEPKVAVTFR